MHKKAERDALLPMDGERASCWILQNLSILWTAFIWVSVSVTQRANQVKQDPNWNTNTCLDKNYYYQQLNFINKTLKKSYNWDARTTVSVIRYYLPLFCCLALLGIRQRICNPANCCWISLEVKIIWFVAQKSKKKATYMVSDSNYPSIRVFNLSK